MRSISKVFRIYRIRWTDSKEDKEKTNMEITGILATMTMQRPMEVGMDLDQAMAAEVLMMVSLGIFKQNKSLKILI